MSKPRTTPLELLIVQAPVPTHQLMLLQPRARFDVDTTARLLQLIEEAIEAAKLLEAGPRSNWGRSAPGLR